MEIYHYKGLPGHFGTHIGFTTPDWMLLHPKEKHNERYRQISNLFGTMRSADDPWQSSDVIEIGINPQLYLNFRAGNIKHSACNSIIELAKQRNQNILFVSFMDLWGFDYEFDGKQENIIQDIYEVIDLYDLDYDKIGICTGNARLDEEIEKISLAFNKPKLKNFYYNTYYLRIPLVERNLDFSLIKRKFLFTNRRSNDVRFELLYNFNKNNMLDEFNWSFNNVMEQKVNRAMTPDDVKQYLLRKSYTKLEPYYAEQTASLIPKILDRTDGFFSADYQDVLPTEFYEQSAFYIIAETHFDSISENTEGYPTFLEGWHSEKSQKAFLNKMPAIFFSTVNTCKYLKKVGYKTFSPVIDESYDEILDDKIRFNKCLEEVNRLYHMTYNEIYDALETLRPVLEHNHKQYSIYSDLTYYSDKVKSLFK